MILILSFNSCNKEENILGVEENENIIKAKFDKKKELLLFKSISDLKETYYNLKISEDPKKQFNKFYKKGYLPLKVSGYLTEKEAEHFYYKRRERFSKNDYNYHEKELIKNDLFANMLNEKGEIQVANKIYKYTEKGIFIVNHKNKYLLKNIHYYEKREKYLTKNLIEKYVPNKNNLPKFKIERINRCGNGEDDGKHYVKVVDDYYGCGTGGGNISNDIPNTSNYNTCINTKDTWLDNIFGRTYVCTYKFNRKRKLRTIFAAEDFLFFTDVYAQAKFKKKTIAGWWFSTKSANQLKVLIKYIY